MQKLNKNKASLTLPKVGKVKIHYSRDLQGKILNASVSHENQKWYISFCCEKILHYNPIAQSEIGIDRGITHTLATSQGEFFDLLLQRIKALEKREKWSKNQKKKQKRINQIDLKIKRIRHDWIDSLCLEADPKFTSQDCSICFYRDNKNRDSQSLFHCQSCGHQENADINASRNILHRVQSPLGGGIESVELLSQERTLRNINL